MTISRLAYAAAFSGQLYFWRRHFFSVITSTQQLFFQNSIEQHFQSKTSTKHHFLRAGSSLEQLHSETATFQVEEFFRIKIFTEKLLFSKQVILHNVIFFKRTVFWKKLIFQKSNILHYLLFLESYLLKVAAFPTKVIQQLLQELPFQKSYNVVFQKSYYFTAALPAHSYTSYLSVIN